MTEHEQVPDQIKGIWDAIGGDVVVNRILTGRATLHVEEKYCLTYVTEENIVMGRSFETTGILDNPRIFKGTKEFKRLILDQQKVSVTMDEITFGYADLLLSATSLVITDELTKCWQFDDIDNFIFYLICFVCRQSDGESGPLLTTKESRNIFCVKNIDGRSIFVILHWDKKNKRWKGDATLFLDEELRKGSRVFVP